MNTQQVDRINELLDQIDGAKREIRAKGGWAEFMKSLGGKEPGGFGLSKSSVSNWGSDLRELRNKAEEQERGLNGEQQEKLRVLGNQVNYLRIKAEQFELTSSGNSVGAKVFYVYFLYVEARKKESELGRAILKINNSNSVEFDNVPDGISVSYRGKCAPSTNKILVFDLTSLERNKKLHIKVYCYSFDSDEIFLGAYITYENNRIVHGSVVLKPVTVEELARVDKLKPLILSYRKNSLIYKNVDPYIKKYLSLKKQNHNKIPNGIRTFNLLKNFTEDYQENPNGRFIEEPYPTVYIAYPTSSVTSNSLEQTQRIIDNLKERLERTFPEKLNIICKGEKLLAPLKRVTAPRSLETIKRTRFFILIYTGADQGSLSLVQLGWAMAHCKSIMIFYQEGTVSEGINRLKSLGYLVRSFKSLNNELEIDSLIEAIEDNLTSNLRRYLIDNTEGI